MENVAVPMDYYFVKVFAIMPIMTDVIAVLVVSNAPMALSANKGNVSVKDKILSLVKDFV